MSTKTYLLAQLEHGVELALERLASESFPHTCAYFRNDEPLAVVLITTWSEESKRPVVHLLGRLGQELAADAVTFTADVWVSSQHSGRRPSSAPTRQEAVQAFAIHDAQVVVSRAVVYTRSAKGDLARTHTEDTWVSGEPGESWLVDGLRSATSHRAPASAEGIHEVSSTLTAVFRCAVFLAGADGHPRAAG